MKEWAQPITITRQAAVPTVACRLSAQQNLIAMNALPLLLAVTLADATPSFSAGFTNLNFERAIIQLNDPDFGWLDWALAVPDWNHSTGIATEVVYYGLPHLGTTQIYMLMDTNTYPAGSFTPYEGDYSLRFASGYATIFPVATDWTQAFISQTAEIPDGTHSLQLTATGPVAVFLNAEPIALFPLGHNRFGADISSFAGTAAELTIINTTPAWAAVSPDWQGRETFTTVDDIIFSPITVPEPSGLIWIGLGMSIFLHPSTHLKL